ncbi:MAG: hypothetical protein AAFV53_23385 [Myxococcota bacterium]
MNPLMLLASIAAAEPPVAASEPGHTIAPLVEEGEPSYRHVPLWVGVAPMPRFGDDRPTVHHLSMSLGLADADRLEGSQLSLGGNRITEDVRGIQASIGGNLAGEVEGAQLSVGANISTGDLTGVQAAVGLNVADAVNGAQTSTGLSVAREVRGAQFSVGAAITGDLKGAQGAVGLSLARDVKGVQMSSGLNIARDVQGVQLGIMNVSSSARVQLGILNVSNDADVMLGIINVNKNGYNHVYGAAGLTDPLTVGVTYGGKRLYNLFEYAGQGGQHSVSIGLGWHQPLGERLYVDVDAAAGGYTSQLLLTNTGLILRGRAVIGAQLAGPVAVFAGPVVQSVVHPFGNDDYDVGFHQMDAGDVVLGGQIGLRL